MPLYEYRCRKCGEISEVIQKFSDEPLTTCKSCGGELERLLSAPAIQFRGEGWYVTDYARKGKGGARKEDSKDSESKGDGSAKSEKSDPSSSSDDKASKKEKSTAPS